MLRADELYYRSELVHLRNFFSVSLSHQEMANTSVYASLDLDYLTGGHTKCSTPRSLYETQGSRTQ